MGRRKGNDYTAWEDVAIMTCWRAGEPWRECAWKIGKTEGAVRERWRRLMEKQREDKRLQPRTDG